MLWYRPNIDSINKYVPVWNSVARARDNAIKLIKRCAKAKKLPRGLDIDRIAHDEIGSKGFGEGIKHTVGHSLGFDSPHGKAKGINWKEYSLIIQNLGYTIEPGIYLKEFGFRTEIDFYVDQNYNVIVTTPVEQTLNIVLDFDKINGKNK